MINKTVYFAQRNPALRERFRPRWRRHGALAMSFPPVWDTVRRYTHCDPVDDPPAALGVTARYDGIGVVWFSSSDAFRVAQKTDAMDRMKVDELETFGKLVRDMSFRCAETVLKDDGQGLFKIFSLMDRAEGCAVADFPARLTDGLAADLIREGDLGPKLARLAVCLPNELSTAAADVGVLNDALLELSFHTLEDAAGFFGSGAYASVAAAHRAAAVEAERCATRELLLDDRDLYD